MDETIHTIQVFLVLFMGWLLGVMTGQGVPERLGAWVIKWQTPNQKETS